LAVSIQLANCTPYTAKVYLNQSSAPLTLKPCAATFGYLPFFANRNRTPKDPPAPGDWGNLNAIYVQLMNGATALTTQVYGSVAEPTWAETLKDLCLWILWNELVLSQDGICHGSAILPSPLAST